MGLVVYNFNIFDYSIQMFTTKSNKKRSSDFSELFYASWTNIHDVSDYLRSMVELMPFLEYVRLKVFR